MGEPAGLRRDRERKGEEGVREESGGSWGGEGKEA